MRIGWSIVALALGFLGCASNSGNGGKVYLERLEPPEGADAGGLSVLVVGSSFGGGPASVFFDGVPATDVEVLSDREIRCTTPPGEIGLAVVEVRSSGKVGRIDTGFEFLPGVESREAPNDSGGNDNFAAYERVPIGYDFQGYIGVADDTDILHFHPPADGKVSISLTWNESYVAGGIAGMNVEFYQGPDPTPEPDAFFGGSILAVGDGSLPPPAIVDWVRPAFLVSGAHGPYLRIQGVASGAGTGFDPVNAYTLRIDYEPDVTLEPAPQADSFRTAIPIDPSSGSVDVAANAGYDDDFDWYSFVPSVDGWARVTISAEGLGSITTNGELSLNAKLFWQDPSDESGNHVFAVAGGAANAADRPGLTANVFEVDGLVTDNTYFLRLRNSDMVGLPAYDYDATVEYGAGDFETAEPGTLNAANTDVAANDLGVLTTGVDTVATGYSFHNGDDDWFRFTTPAAVGTTLTITWSHAALSSGVNGIGSFDSQLNPLGGEFSLLAFDQAWFTTPGRLPTTVQTIGGLSYDVSPGEDVESVVVSNPLSSTNYYVLVDTVRGWSTTESWTLTVNVSP